MDVQRSVIAPPVPFPQPRLAFDIERRAIIRSIIEPILREKHPTIIFTISIFTFPVQNFQLLENGNLAK